MFVLRFPSFFLRQLADFELEPRGPGGQGARERVSSMGASVLIGGECPQWGRVSSLGASVLSGGECPQWGRVSSVGAKKKCPRVSSSVLSGVGVLSGGECPQWGRVSSVGARERVSSSVLASSVLAPFFCRPPPTTMYKLQLPIGGDA